LYEWEVFIQEEMTLDTRNVPLQAQNHAKNLSVWARRALAWCFAGFITLLLIIGWRLRDESSISAADGMGYAIGIIGGSLMLLLLLYPVRKHVKAIRSWGPIKYWFQLHMLFGVIGPVMIIFHANFGLGSTNSNLALFSMLLVAGSGLIGRYFYTKIHFGLYGHQASLKELRQEIQLTKGNLGAHISLSHNIVKLIKQHEKYVLKNRNFVAHLFLLPIIYLRSILLAHKIKSSVLRDLSKQAKANNWGNEMLLDFIKQAKTYLRYYFYCLRKTSHLSIYARLFSAWHIFHLPLFILLVITGIVHVIAVHMY